MLFIVAGLFGFARDMALGVFADAPFWQSLFGAVGSTLGRLPGYLWSARLGLLVFGLVGLGLAAVDAARHRVHRAWRGQLGFIVLVGVITALVIGVQYVNREGAYAWVADQPELFSQQDVVLVSDLVIFGGSLFMSLSLSYLIWAAWTYWFSRWVVWLRAPRPSPEDEAVHTQPPRTSDDWREYQARLAHLKRGDSGATDPQSESEAPEPPTGTRESWTGRVVAALAVTVVASFLLLQVYHARGPDVAGGELWVTPERPGLAADLTIPRSPHRVIVSNTAGEGMVEVQLARNAEQPVRQINDMQLAGRAGQFRTATLDMTGMPAGTYRLTTILREGEGGHLRYMALFGGGAASRTAAAALGLTTGLALSLLTMLILELTASR